MTATSYIRIFGFVDYSSPDILFRTLSDPVKRQLARLLAETPLIVGEIVDILNLPQSTVSRHLKNLRTTGLLVERREGNRIFTGLKEPLAEGEGGLGDLLNRWVRGQPLSDIVMDRMEQVLRNRSPQEDSFERLAHQWDELRRHYFGTHFHLEALCSLLPGHWHILDVGTGTGYLLPLLSRQFRKVTAVDPSPSMLKLARKRAQRDGLENVVFEFGSLEVLPLASDCVDAALAILVLHHGEDLGSSLAELHRVLKKGGRLLAVDFEPHEMTEFQQEMGDPSKGLEPSSLETLLGCTGFTELSCRPLDTSHDKGVTRPSPNLYLFNCTKA